MPLDAVNAEGQRDKSLTRQHPKALHWWWARRPLAVCRAVVFAQLVDDPGSRPDLFPTWEEQGAERERLLEFIRRLVVWENSNDSDLMSEAAAYIARSYDGSPPRILDPFCGGGSIPVEARRLGLLAVGSDINPIATLITRSMIDLPGRFAGEPPTNMDARETQPMWETWPGSSGLANDVDYYGRVLIDEARKQTAALFVGPEELLAEGELPLAWIWARTVTCPNRACGGVIPLTNSFWLSRPTSKNKPQVFVSLERSSAGGWMSFTNSSGGRPPEGTVRKNSVICPLCTSATSVEYVKREGAAGRMGQQMLAVLVNGAQGKVFRTGDVPPTLAPDEPIGLLTEAIPFHPQYLQLPKYGFTTFDSLFTLRQQHLLRSLIQAVPLVRERVLSDGASTEYTDAVLTYIGFLIDRIANRNSSQSFWNPGRNTVEAATANNYLPMRWTFAEANPFADASGGALGQLQFLVSAIESLPAGPRGEALQRDVVRAPLEAGAAFCTDPPYFGNVPYADLSDFYYVLLKRTLGAIYPDIFSTILTPKADELVADSTRHGGEQGAAEFFREGLHAAFAKMAEATEPETPIVVYYALRQQETDSGMEGVVSTGWERMLEGLLESGLGISATWPVRTEQSGGLRVQGRNALASSVAIVCRPRRLDASMTTRNEFLTRLRQELPEALRQLQRGNIAPVDLAQAAIGPGMAVYSRYSKVMAAGGAEMRVREALAVINQVLDETLSEQEAEFDHDTRWALAWFDSYGLKEGPFGQADVLARAKDTSVQSLREDGFVLAKANKVRLLGWEEFNADWDPITDERLTIWEITHYLIRAHQGPKTGSELAAADLLKKVGHAMGETARDLAYRLYSISERMGWAKEALAYNALVVAWPEIARLATAGEGGAQSTLGV